MKKVKIITELWGVFYNNGNLTDFLIILMQKTNLYYKGDPLAPSQKIPQIRFDINYPF